MIQYFWIQWTLFLQAYKRENSRKYIVSRKTRLSFNRSCQKQYRTSLVLSDYGDKEFDMEPENYAESLSENDDTIE